MQSIVVRKGRERSLLRRHPWVFSGALAEPVEPVASGETVRVVTEGGHVLGVGAYSPRSQIRLRMWAFGEVEIGPDVVAARIRSSVARRGDAAKVARGACRLVYSESDGVPGFIADRYADWLVVQFLSAGAEAWRETILDALSAAVPSVGIFERSDTAGRTREGFEPRTGVLRGEAPPDRIEIEEAGLRYLVDIVAGHKTGFYLDQAQNRAAARAYCADRDVLNAFCYTGGFTLNALAAGARRVTNIDTSADALALLGNAVALNGFDAARCENLTADVFVQLRKFRDERRSFDTIILDPPKFAESAGQVHKAARGYKDINLLAFKLLRPGGTLITFSCSGHIEPALFGKIVADAALDAGRDAHILSELGQPPDHPVSLAFPEGRYLKGLVLQCVHV